MNEMLQHIEKIFNENRLIGNYDFTEEEYSLMLENVRISSVNFTDISFHKLIFATLVEIAKRWRRYDTNNNEEENSGYWDYVFKVLFSSGIDQQLCQRYRNAISNLGEFHNIPIVTSGQKFYATVMMHAFAPRKSIYSFFDLCYNVFKKDLDFGFTSDDEWLCEIVAEQMKNVLGGGYQEDKLVSIGSSAYSIKIGLRSFVLNESLSVEFNRFTKGTFYNINKLFNREIIEGKTRLERCIIDWWKNKTESEKISDETVRKRRISTVSKQDITARYIKNNNEILLCIPSIRLDGNNSTMQISIYVNERPVSSEEMRTKRGELVVATKPIDFKLNELLHCSNSINIRIEIQEDGTTIFNSEKSKATSLNREFLLFDGEKEIISQINKPANYFIYSLNIDALEGVQKLENEDRLITIGTNLYNIYPKAGESLKGETKHVFFVDKTKTTSLGTNACLIGSVADVEWVLDDISCIVYRNAVKLMIPESFNLKALELRIDNRRYKLQELNYEQIELNCYQFGLKALELLSDYYPTEILLYSYEKEKVLFAETIIVLPYLDIEFNNSFYYGNLERKITVKSGNEPIELTWDNQENEIICPFNDGFLVIKVPCLKWRINNNEWHNEPINKKLWYRDFLQNGDLLEIDSPKGNGIISVFGSSDGKKFEIIKNQSGKFEIGRAVFANENKTDISIYFSDEKNKFNLFNTATKEHFIENPISYSNGKVFWIVEETFLGDKDNTFLLDVGGRRIFRGIIDGRNKEILSSISEDVYKIKVKIKDKNIFSREDRYDTIFEGHLTVGAPEKFKFKNKKIILLSANCYTNKSSWIPFAPKYFIDELQYIQEKENVYYRGRLSVIEQNGEAKALDTMKNENGSDDETNPIRIELRDNKTLWLVAGWKGSNDFHGTLFLDKKRKSICNIAQQNAQYDEINLYKFKEEEYV